MKRKLTSRFFGLLICMVMVIGIMPAYAAEPATSEFDFSNVDTLNTYAEYRKEQSDNGYEYVYCGKQNYINTNSTMTFEDFRYGAYLTNNIDPQYYAVSNLDYKEVISSNVLTIYADPEVQFEITDINGKRLANDISSFDPFNVKVYNKTTDYGHNLYYIQFNPMETNKSRLMIKFYTDSTTVQPHYSFWFGHPLVREGIETVKGIELLAVKPNSTPGEFPVHALRIPENSWVRSVTVKKTGEEEAYAVDNAYLTVLTPGQTKNRQNVDVRNNNEAVFEFVINGTFANPAWGEYTVQFKNVRWNNKVQGTALYKYKGDVEIKYLYAVGTE